MMDRVAHRSYPYVTPRRRGRLNREVGGNSSEAAEGPGVWPFAEYFLLPVTLALFGIVLAPNATVSQTVVFTPRFPQWQTLLVPAHHVAAEAGVFQGAGVVRRVEVSWPSLVKNTVLPHNTSHQTEREFK